MDCFRHPEHAAVGLCRSCYRGVCAECAAEVEGSLACRGNCEQDVAQLVSMLRSNVRLQSAAERQIATNPRIRLMAGALFIVMGIASLPLGLRGGPSDGFLRFFSGFLFAFGLLLLWSGRPHRG